jgi:drug/metabolite transporter (DMT)-like permease
MRRADVARLVALAMIWSASFVFMRVLAPALGPLWIAASRVLIGGGALVAWFAATRFDAGLARHWRAYLVVGVLNSALPFALYGYAAAHLPASYMALLNAATPLFAVLAAALWLGEPLTALKIAGVASGAAGVALVSRAGAPGGDASFLLAVAACLVAAASYALAGAWLKRNGAGLKSLAVAGWSQLLAGVALLPFAAAAPAPGPFTPELVASMLALGLLCSGVAYILYYRLMVDVGPAKTLTVAFLIPFFAVLWGVLFLGEAVTPAMLAGGALIVGGTAAVLRPAPVLRAAAG